MQEHCPDCDVVVVAHGGILRSLIANLLDLGIEQQNRLHFDNTSLSVVTKTPRGMALMLLNDTSTSRTGRLIHSALCFFRQWNLWQEKRFLCLRETPW